MNEEERSIFEASVSLVGQLKAVAYAHCEQHDLCESIVPSVMINAYREVMQTQIEIIVNNSEPKNGLSYIRAQMGVVQAMVKSIDDAHNQLEEIENDN